MGEQRRDCSFACPGLLPWREHSKMGGGNRSGSPGTVFIGKTTACFAWPGNQLPVARSGCVHGNCLFACQLVFLPNLAERFCKRFWYSITADSVSTTLDHGNRFDQFDCRTGLALCGNYTGNRTSFYPASITHLCRSEEHTSELQSRLHL